jgi:hypothetical protein
MLSWKIGSCPNDASKSRPPTIRFEIMSSRSLLEGSCFFDDVLGCHVLVVACVPHGFVKDRTS